MRDSCLDQRHRRDPTGDLHEDAPRPAESEHPGAGINRCRKIDETFLFFIRNNE